MAAEPDVGITWNRRGASLFKGLADFDTSWRGGIFAVSIILAGVMARGYAVFDELGVYCILATAMFVTGRRDAVSAAPGKNTKLESSREWIDATFKGAFVLTMLYLMVETLRGIVALSDLRVLRFTIMFIALAIIASRIAMPESEIERDKIARTIVASTAFYFLMYIIVGLTYELFFDGWRFDLQGNIWAGTSAAVLPGLVFIPALVRLARSEKTIDVFLSWAGVASFLIASFYYQSRLSWMALGLFDLALVVLGKYGRAVVLSIVFCLFVVAAPWNDPRPATPAEIGNYVRDVISDAPGMQPAYNLRQFFGIVFSPFLPVENSDKVVARFQGQVVAQFSLRSFPSQAQVDQKIQRLKRKGYTVTVEKEDESSPDIDRKLAILAALKTASSGGVGTLLFGAGYYVHRFAMLPYIQEIASEHHYTFPPSYRSIVRTATLNGMLVDNGVVGFSLFLLLFVFVALAAGASVVPLDRSAAALSGSAVTTLLLLGLSQFAGSNFDMMVIYLALMPGGLIASIVRRS